MKKSDKMTFRITSRICACLLLLLVATPGTAAGNYKQACNLTPIKDSFKQLIPSDMDIPKLQQQLKSGKFPKLEVTGKLDSKTHDALKQFCLELGGQDVPVPSTNPKKPNADLANFLIEKASDIKDEKEDPKEDPKEDTKEDPKEDTKEDTKEEAAGCDVDSIADRFQGVASVKIKSMQQLMKAGGNLTDWADGRPGPETYHALARLCRYMENTGLLVNEEDKDQPALDRFKELLTAENLDEVDEVATMLQQQNSQITLSAIDSIAAAPTESCGCSRDFSAKVYGFLPYWLADGTPWGVDFSMLERIGFHALQIDKLDDDGKILHQSLWSKGSGSESQVARFIATAHRHRVKVDITFYSSQWMEWDPVKINQVAAAVEQAASQEFSDTSDDDEVVANLLSLLRKLLPFVEDNSTVRADGINLYFDQYKNSADAGKIIEIVTAVGRRMPDASLNIMLEPDWSGIGGTRDGNLNFDILGINKELFANLKDALKDDAEVEVANLFVFLPRNTENGPKKTSNAKKLLRLAIENAFDGDGKTRRTVLRKTLPIIVTFNDKDQPKDYFGTEKSAFIEDLIYLQDNFAGVGLWPLPLVVAAGDVEDNSGAGEDASGDAASSPEPEQAEVVPPNDGVAIGKSLVAEYEVKADWRKDPKWQEIDNLAAALCEFACPNRWLFRLTFDFLAGLLAIYGLLALGNCRLREIYQQKSLYFLGYGLVTALIFTVSLVCDPFWKEVSGYVLTGIVLVLVGFFGFRQVRKTTHPKYP
jgi:hypothetical protein